MIYLQTCTRKERYGTQHDGENGGPLFHHHCERRISAYPRVWGIWNLEIFTVLEFDRKFRLRLYDARSHHCAAPPKSLTNHIAAVLQLLLSLLINCVHSLPVCCLDCPFKRASALSETLLHKEPTL